MNKATRICGIIALVLLTRLIPFDFSAVKQPEPILHAQGAGIVGWNNIHMARVTADFTDGGAVTTLQNIAGLSFALPANQAVTYKIDCDIYYSQATVVADGLGIQFSVAPSSAIFGGTAATNVTAFATIAPPTITTTTATTVITMTPAVTTVLYAHMGGAVENAGGGVDNIVNLSVSQSTAANVIVIKRGSACVYHSMS